MKNQVGEKHKQQGCTYSYDQLDWFFARMADIPGVRNKEVCQEQDRNKPSYQSLILILLKESLYRKIRIFRD